MGTFAYFPHTEEDIKVMLERVGVSSVDELYADVPQEFIHKGEYDLPSAMSEEEVRAWFESLAAKNTRLKVFAGAGAYDHYTPSVIPYITSRSEFLTAYTPYQCEISQGTLRYIFEWQTMICSLTGMDVANASMWNDGGQNSVAVAVDAQFLDFQKVAARFALGPQNVPRTAPKGELFCGECFFKGLAVCVAHHQDLAVRALRDYRNHSADLFPIKTFHKGIF